MQSRGAMAAGLAGLIVILAALVGSGIQPVAAQAGFTTYKLAVQWPPTWCSSATCIQPYLREFTIHGLWPQLPPDTPVLPYAQNSTCTTVAPVQSHDIMQHIVRGTRSNLWAFWPNLRDYNDPRANWGFWQYKWGQYGMCSDWADQPNIYSSTGLRLHYPYRSLCAVLGGAGFRPNNTITYRVGVISDELRRRYGRNRNAPQILCSLAGRFTKQLAEIRFRYRRNQNGPNQFPFRTNCPYKFVGACRSSNDYIIFREP